ncbi:MAG: nucleotide disphospho-sugar-binding domain-containing protein, partial [Ardenticatenales bacterium]
RPEDMIRDLVADQFTQLALAAPGCDVIVGAGAFQFAARSIAEHIGAAYVNAVYAPTSIPSPDLPPGAPPGEAWRQVDRADTVRRWEADALSWNERFLVRMNDNRAALGLPPLDDTRRHILGTRPLLAADRALGPAPNAPDLPIVQTGAWLLADSAPLSPELEAFLQGGEPPIYIGFGSMPAAPGLGRTVLDAARHVGRRAIVSSGWADFDPIDAAPDWIAIGDVNQQALFPRVAAVVHHGGAGTTTTAAHAGAAQVVAPMFSDQFYWAMRVGDLGIGMSVPIRDLTAAALASALQGALEAVVADRAASIAPRIALDGAAVAAAEIIARRA